jgi:DNA-directed RNA polymerase specialized sigma24 family protein
MCCFMTSCFLAVENRALHKKYEVLKLVARGNPKHHHKMNLPSDIPFPATRWSLVAGARAGMDPKRKQAAVDELCRLYWKPIYGFLRRRGLTADDAQDATQGFFVSLLDEDLFSKAQSDTGKMRTFLLAALQRWQRGEWRKSMAEKRGGGITPLSLEGLQEEDDFDAPDSASESPEAFFEKQCALVLLENAMHRLAKEQASAGKAEAFEVLRPLLSPASGVQPSYEEAAQALRLSPEALRVTLHRLRKRFADVLKDAIADTLTQPTEEAIQEELQALRQAFG